MRIAFVYSGGREARWDAAKRGDGPSDFFYGAVEMQGMEHEVSVHDLPVRSKDAIADLTGLFLRGILPPKTGTREVLAARRLLRQLQRADLVVATTSGCAFALGVWKQLGLLKPALVGIHCGIVNIDHSHAPKRSAAWVLQGMKSVLFSDSEASEMERQFGEEDLFPAWFGVDETFWSPPDAAAVREGVLAVGNDARRDYETLVDAARRLPRVNFRVVTRSKVGENLPQNVEHIRGDWKTNAIDDERLREFYRCAACVVVPLTESIQPAGQSVGMQAMMCGAPVVLTRTSGWWGADVLEPGKHLVEAVAEDSRSLADGISKAMGRTFPAREALLAADWTATGFARRILEFSCS